MNLLDETIAALPDVDSARWMGQARARWNSLAKAAGGFGALEEMVSRLCALQETLTPKFENRWCVAMAGDHGVAAEGVSSAKPENTAQIVRAMMNGKTAVNLLSKRAGCELLLVDMGVNADLPDGPFLLKKKVGKGTKNILHEAAMSEEEAVAGICAGIETANLIADKGADLIVTGDVGVGSTTAAAAITCVTLGAAPDNCTGHGGGIDDQTWLKKVKIVGRALEVNAPSPHDPLALLAKVGGFEIAGLVGLMLGAARRRVPFLVDGFVCTAALHIANTMHWKVQDWAFIGQLSSESAHQVALDYFAQVPLLQLRMRMGEAAGALLALPVLEAAMQTFAEMATCEEAGVTR